MPASTTENARPTRRPITYVMLALSSVLLIWAIRLALTHTHGGVGDYAGVAMAASLVLLNVHQLVTHVALKRAIVAAHVLSLMAALGLVYMSA